MKKVIGFFTLVIMFSACMENSYDYVEIVAEQSMFGGIETKENEVKAIKANSDTSAYLKAFERFCISVKVTNDMKQAYGEVYTTPVDFKLLNSDGVDISKTIFFADKGKREAEIEASVNSLGNHFQESLDRNRQNSIEEFKKVAKIDSVKVAELEKHFRIKIDEFSNENKKWYEPKSAPKYINRNGIYCYFHTENGLPGNLRFKVQYYAEDWLFFNRIQFSIDGKAYEFIPADTETDSGNGGYIWEWFDQGLTMSDRELIYALSNAKNAKMKLIGRQYHKIKAISQEQINGIKQTLELYNALGGQY